MGANCWSPPLATCGVTPIRRMRQSRRSGRIWCLRAMPTNGGSCPASGLLTSGLRCKRFKGPQMCIGRFPERKEGPNSALRKSICRGARWLRGGRCGAVRWRSWPKGRRRQTRPPYSLWLAVGCGRMDRRLWSAGWSPQVQRFKGGWACGPTGARQTARASRHVSTSCGALRHCPMVPVVWWFWSTGGAVRRTLHLCLPSDRSVHRAG